MMKSIAMKQHPISTVLLILYIVISIVQGSLEMFIAGFLAASAAYALELMFRATGMIRTGRYCAGHPRSCKAVKTLEKRRRANAA